MVRPPRWEAPQQKASYTASSGTSAPLTKHIQNSWVPLHDFEFPIATDPDSLRREARLREVTIAFGAREFRKPRAGIIHAMDGGLWLHRHVWLGRPMVHFVSTDRDRLLDYGEAVGIPASRLQYKPLRDPRTGERRDAWHWDLGGPVYPPVDERLLVD